MLSHLAEVKWLFKATWIWGNFWQWLLSTFLHVEPLPVLDLTQMCLLSGWMDGWVQGCRDGWWVDQTRSPLLRKWAGGGNRLVWGEAWVYFDRHELTQPRVALILGHESLLVIQELGSLSGEIFNGIDVSRCPSLWVVYRKWHWRRLTGSHWTNRQITDARDTQRHLLCEKLSVNLWWGPGKLGRQACGSGGCAESWSETKWPCLRTSWPLRVGLFWFSSVLFPFAFSESQLDHAISTLGCL
jgi:hypothetical protein